MLWEDRQSNYDKYPKIKIKEIDKLSSKAYEGYADIVSKIKAIVENLYKEKVVMVLDYYHGVNVLNLIEGEEAIVTSPENVFAPFVVHYAETFIIPENIKEYTIAPYGKSIGQKNYNIKSLCASLISIRK